MHAFLIVFAAAVGVGALCRLSIPDSGGASMQPVAFSSTSITRIPLIDTVIPGDSFPISDYCAGSSGCSQACCVTNNCFAWAWKTGGSVHAACGSNTCEIFVAAPGADWRVLALSSTMESGYNVAGYVFSTRACKVACCVTGAPPSAVGCDAPGSS